MQGNFETSLTIPAEVHYLPAVLDFVRAFFGARPETSPHQNLLYTLELVVAEGCSNIMRYAYPEGAGLVTLEIGVVPGEVNLRLLDTGQLFDPHAIPRPDSERGQVGGYGVFIIRESVDRFEYSRRDGQNILDLRLEIPE